MIELTIVACVVVVALAALLGYQAHELHRERSEWRAERRFLIDRAITSHVGELIPLEQLDNKKNSTIAPLPTAERYPIEGLS